ncbi:hypothetical protein MSHOH_2241 [Methanosarcina horonobensis HB-1 = JCM 15518]|uniref:Uncharacterized protein n=1 Tax=Methanosarcina horonobensis HB-1 = JCM 15518 TaxID=1434110 RepID=A0A0E3SAI9_9EURY|nr:hypothetical protein MSHOH_2241 [Methanosarcina horonobensis HB-1 = JCM 15518]
MMFLNFFISLCRINPVSTNDIIKEKKRGLIIREIYQKGDFTKIFGKMVVEKLKSPHLNANFAKHISTYVPFPPAFEG